MATTVESGEYLFERMRAKRSATLVQVLALGAAALCITLAAWLQAPINRQRRELNLVTQSDIYKELPPKYAWVSAAGGAFRGIVADLLWMRADRLKQEGKFYEAHQLSEWICTLQPRFPEVWSFHSWNMSYNISVATHTAPERWQWVYNGIRLLRDEGIPNNEKVVGLYRQLAWTWHHKVGNRQDDMHWYYKRMWAATMETLLGPPPVGLSDAETIDWFRPVADAPMKLDEVISASPGVKGLVDRLADAGVDVTVGTSTDRVYHPLEEKFFLPYTRFVHRDDYRALGREAAEPSARDQRLFDIFATADSKDLNALLAHLRARVLLEQYKMDPRYMLAMTGRLYTEHPIPIDWRTPWSQAMYWSMYGSDMGGAYAKAKEFDLINTDRILFFSLADLARYGRVLFRIDIDQPMNSYLTYMPDPRYIEAMHKSYIAAGVRHAEPGEEVGETAGEMLRSGHVNNLQSAIVLLYLGGKEAEARNYLQYLADNYKNMVTKETEKQYMGGVEAFVTSQITEMRDIQDVVFIIVGLMQDAYMNLLSGYGDEFNSAMDKAAKVYADYQKDKLDDPEGRRQLPPYEELRAGALWSMLVGMYDEAMPVIDRSLIYRRESEAIKLRIYDQAYPALLKLCQATGLDVDKAFPVPAGIEQYRREHPMPDQPGRDVTRQDRTVRPEAATQPVPSPER